MSSLITSVTAEWLRAHPLIACAVASVLFPLIWRWTRRQPNVAGQVVFITGGSEGIGKALAAEFVRRGANVCIFARTPAKLDAAVAELEKEKRGPGAAAQRVGRQAMDVTQPDSIRDGIAAAVETYGPPDTLITCAGSATPGYFLDQDPSVFERTMNLNYMGNVRVIKAVAPLMVERGHGRIMIVSSALAVCSFIGYASYSPSKFALRGLADALRTELSGFGIKVSICYPPDTDTPGFAVENKSKPPETLACFPADAYKSESVARQSISSLLRGDYHIQSPDPLQNLLVSSMSGITPRAFTALETMLLPIITLVEQLFWMWWDFQAGKYAKRTKNEAAKAKKAD